MPSEWLNDDARDSDRCGLFCDEEPQETFVDEWGVTNRVCRDCYERSCGRCFGDIRDEYKRKGLCQNCRDEIRMWGGDEDRGVEKDPGNEQTKLLTDGGTPLPADEIVTPSLTDWDARPDGSWATWVAPDERFRVHVEMVDLEVPDDEAVLTGFEVRLDDLRDGRPYDVVARETLRNSHLALGVADLLAAAPTKYADEWDEGLAPRPEEVGR